MFKKLHLGCGNKVYEGYLNCDRIIPKGFENADNVIAFDLEGKFPLEDNTFEEVLAVHVLEHIGQTVDKYLSFLKELYRVCKDQATINIVVPHYNDSSFKNDPTHVRIITPDGLSLFSKKFNKECIEKGFSNSTLGLDYDLDFQVVEVNEILNPFWLSQLQNGQIRGSELHFAKLHYNNVISQYDITLKVIKENTKTS